MIKIPKALAITSFVIVVTSTINAKLPEHNYACQVTTAREGDGLILIQANSFNEAVEEAIKSEALTANRHKARTIQVKECIEIHKGKFADREFQRFYENTPM